MDNAYIREQIRQALLTAPNINSDKIDVELLKISILEGEKFAGGFVGVDPSTFEVIYDFYETVESMARTYVAMGDEDIEDARLQAEEWLEYNTMRSLSYIREREHVIVPRIINRPEYDDNTDEIYNLIA